MAASFPTRSVLRVLGAGVLASAAVLVATILGIPGPASRLPFTDPAMALGSVRPRCETVVVVWFSKASVGDEVFITETIEKTFGFSVSMHGPMPVPSEARLYWSGQVDPLVILDYLVDTIPLDAVRVLGVVDVDLAGGKAPWSLGFGQPEGKAAVISLFRLNKALAEGIRDGGDPETLGALYRLRLYKLVCHELGHTFRELGRIHCPDPACLMHTIEFGLEDLDRVPPRYCPSCRREIATSVNGPVNTAVTYYHLGLYFEERGLFERAVQAYQRSLLLDPTFRQAWNNLGVSWVRSGDDASAEPAFRKALEADSGYVLARYNLGRLLARRGGHSEALECFEECLRLDEGFTPALREGGRLWRDGMKDPREALAWFKRFLEAGGRDEEVERWLERGD